MRRKMRVWIWLAWFLAGLASAAVRTEVLEYRIEGEPFTGYLAWDDKVSGARPGVLVVHEWWGHNEYARRRARELAAAGYVALALDMYGKGRVTEHPDDAKRFMQAVLAEQGLARRRFEAAYRLLLAQPQTDRTHVAAIGYCFGGGVVLNMARAGLPLDAVVSFHGMLGTDRPARPGTVRPRVLVFTGEADPFVPGEQVAAFEREMRAAGARFELIRYPGVKHAFTNPDADRLGREYDLPLKYDAQADRDAWQRMLAFLRQALR
ncbi:MAG TPA: dienelactone hydrolase family protein [Gammaproteobacteria bacterium]|nr:dienelactone hydrolase family protein [Gammaproteobacteria bacterium]